jgi:hypothetical protein
MLDRSHILELRSKFYYVSHSFGSPEDLIQTVADDSNDQEEVELKIHQILSHPDHVRVISPWDTRFDLIEENVYGVPNEKSIVIESPYQVFDFNRCLLYTVSQHEGTWGNSPLDKLLMLQSPSGRIFYLQHATFTDTKRTLLLIVNNLALTGGNALADNDLLKTPPFTDATSGSNLNKPAIEPQDNIILLNTSRTLPRNSFITIYHLKSSPSVIPIYLDVINNPETTSYGYPITSIGERLSYFPSASGWVYIQVRIENINAPVSIEDIKGNGVDRFVQANQFVYYVAVGDEMDTVMLRQKLGLVTRRPPDFSQRDVIQLEANLST